MTKNLPALESVIELCICKCKTGCASLRCICKKTASYVQKCVYVLIVTMTKMIMMLTPILTLTKSNIFEMLSNIATPLKFEYKILFGYLKNQTF